MGAESKKKCSFSPSIASCKDILIITMTVHWEASISLI